MPDRRFFAKGPVSKRTVYVHFVNKQEFDRMSKFRDKLIKDQDLAKEYSNLKEKLAIENSKKRDSYTSAKHDFIRSDICASRSFYLHSIPLILFTFVWVYIITF